MRIPRIYTPENLQQGSTVLLDPLSARHLLSVLRFKPGRELVLFNGRGGEYRGILVDARESLLDSYQSIKAGGKSARKNKAEKAAVVRVTDFIDINRESSLAIELGIGISRGERMDWVVQKATELGVKKITPLFTERTKVRLDSQRVKKKIAHWHQVAISACEQSGRTQLPELVEPLALADWQTSCDLRFVLDPEALQKLGNYQKAGFEEPQQLALLIGPEGGLSEAEIQQCQAGGYQRVSLGPRVLRTETAPLTAIALCQARWGDL